MGNDLIRQYRFFLKDTVRKQIDFSKTGQSSGMTPPPVQKPFDKDGVFIDLPEPDSFKGIPDIKLSDAIRNRRSRRSFLRQPLSLEELSFLLWATQGVREKIDEAHAYRTVPSAGCRHAFETYLCVFNVTSLKQGIYRYIPFEHGLLFEFSEENLRSKVIEAAFGQRHVGESAVTFVWTAIPYRMEWRYDLAAHKVIAIDAGHVCQNLYLACEAVSAGTCAIAAYDQEKMDSLLRIDGEDEFAIYVAPVGKVGN